MGKWGGDEYKFGKLKQKSLEVLYYVVTIILKHFLHIVRLCIVLD